MDYKKLHLFFFIVNLIFTSFLFYWIYTIQNTPPDFSNDIIKAKGIVITDDFGVERVILGAPLPDPTMTGYRKYRGSDEGIAGIMLYDAEGQERGGYVTDSGYGNIYLTLDSKTQQNALFIGDPLGGAAMQVWAKNGNKISFSAGDDGLYLDLIENNVPLKLMFNE